MHRVTTHWGASAVGAARPWRGAPLRRTVARLHTRHLWFQLCCVQVTAGGWRLQITRRRVRHTPCGYSVAKSFRLYKKQARTMGSLRHGCKVDQCVESRRRVAGRDGQEVAWAEGPDRGGFSRCMAGSALPLPHSNVGGKAWCGGSSCQGACRGVVERGEARDCAKLGQGSTEGVHHSSWGWVESTPAAQWEGGAGCLYSWALCRCYRALCTIQQLPPPWGRISWWVISSVCVVGTHYVLHRPDRRLVESV
jgi:hypothetical protein